MSEETHQDPQVETDDEQAPPKYEFTAEDAGTLKKKVTVTVPRDRINAKLDEMFGELGRTAQVPGFRIGRAPRRLVEKRFGKDVSQDVRNALVGEALGQTLEEAQFTPLGEPEVDLEAIDLPETDDMQFSFEVEIAPEFNLPDLKGIAVEKTVNQVTDDRINEYLDQLRQSQATFEDTENPAAEGDVVTADVQVGEGMVNPVEIKDQILRVAPGQIEGLPLVNLGKELSGKKTGDAVTMSVQVPQSLPNEAWRGEDAKIEIALTNVRRRILPKLDEQLAQKMGFASLEELRQFVAERMEQNVQAETQQAMREQICRYLLDNTDFDLPEGVAARHAARTLQRRYVDLLRRGVPRERIDENITELKAAADQQSAQDLKLQFIIGKIAQAEGFGAEEGEINARIAQIAASYNRRPERMRQELEQDGSLNQIENQIVEEKVLDKLLEDAAITEISKKTEKKSKTKKAPAKKKAKAADKKKPKETAATKTKKTAKKTAKKSAKKAAKKTSKKPKSK